MEIIAFSQRDPRWAGETLGTGEPTIGEAGCLLTAAASLLASWSVVVDGGQLIDPHRLNEQLKRSWGYVDGNLFEFASIDGLGCRFVEFIDCWAQAAPLERLINAVGAGAGLLACVDGAPGGTVQPHWVWVVSLGERSGQIVDPWQEPGRAQVGLATYLKAGWTPARGIFLAALYTRIAGQRAAWRSARGGDAHQPMVYVRPNGHGGVSDGMAV